MDFNNPGEHWTKEWLNSKRQIADPPVDELINQMVANHGIESSKNLFEKLITNIELPWEELTPEVHEFFTQPPPFPAWYGSLEKENSYALFADHGPKMLLLLFYKALPLLYTDQKGARVLAGTGRLMHSEGSLHIFSRRIAETGQFLLHIMRWNGLDPENTGLLAAKKVRLIHGAIRHFLKYRDWDTQTNGEPINQEDMALTLMSFSIALIDGLQQLGIHEEEEKLNAYLKRWNYVGVLLGIQDDILPENIQEARNLLEKILKRQSTESPEGKLLTKVLVEFSKKSIPGMAFDITPEILISYFVGEKYAGYLGIQTPRGCLSFVIPAFLRSYFKWGEKYEDQAPEIARLADKISLKLVRGMVKYFDTYKERYFEVPVEFAGQWGY